MTDTSAPQPPITGQTNSPSKKSGKWQLSLIILMTVVPILLAYVSYYTGIGVPEGTVNQGVILEPSVQFSDLKVAETEQLPDFKTEPKWRILIPVDGECQDACQQHLYVTRQVNIRLAKDSERIERYAINLSGDAGERFLSSIAPEYPKLKKLTASLADWNTWLGSTNAPKDLKVEHYYIMVDPLGRAMMYYNASHDGNQLLKDIKRILRYTPDE